MMSRALSEQEIEDAKASILGLREVLEQFESRLMKTEADLQSLTSGVAIYQFELYTLCLPPLKRREEIAKKAGASPEDRARWYQENQYG